MVNFTQIIHTDHVKSSTDPERNFHYVIDCAKKIMKEHCYWPIVSDFNNVLSHEKVALVFLKDDKLIDMWFQFLSMLQGK
jgi:E3 ubiquitin-protein ligase UBR3